MFPQQTFLLGNFFYKCKNIKCKMSSFHIVSRAHYTFSRIIIHYARMYLNSSSCERIEFLSIIEAPAGLKESVGHNQGL